MSHRLHKVNENLQRELSMILAEQADADQGFVTITHVLTTPDLRDAEVWLSVLNNPQPSKVIDSLNARASDFYTRLSERIMMKFVPRLTFKLDEHSDDAIRIDSLLDEINNDEA